MKIINLGAGHGATQPMSSSAPGSMHKLAIVEGDAIAILEAIHEATYRGWSNIVFESDSKVVVDPILANQHGISALSNIISSIKLLLQCDSNFEIKFTKRQANITAHIIARTVIF
ncbi:hypothetical protein QL285_002249 [Trifolium repens]|nr:hypothetical protein QL285_002249 [Trifolium repens]